MPLNFSTYRYQFFVDYMDYKGDLARYRYYLASSTEAGALADMKTLCSALMLVCQGQLYAAGLEIVFTDLQAPAPDPASNIEELALISCTQTPSNKPYNLTIPALAVSARVDSVSPGYWQVDVTNPDLVALMDYFLTGGIALGRNGEPLTDDGTHVIIAGSSIYTESTG